jgi:uncharacterized protein YbjT (DUF2867 family)
VNVERAKPARVALVAGATGFVGGALVRALMHAPDYSRVYAVTRRPLPLEHAKLANRIFPLEQIQKQMAGFQCHDIYCCLGSTRQRAGSDHERAKVDRDLVVGLGRAGLVFGAARFIVVSSAGADAKLTNPYLKAKGEMEEQLRKLALPSLDVLRPGLLLGSRNEFRPMEFAAGLLARVVGPVLGEDVAYAMLGAARSLRRGTYVYEGAALPALAATGRAQR